MFLGSKDSTYIFDPWPPGWETPQSLEGSPAKNGRRFFTTTGADASGAAPVTTRTGNHFLDNREFREMFTSTGAEFW